MGQDLDALQLHVDAPERHTGCPGYTPGHTGGHTHMRTHAHADTRTHTDTTLY